MHIFLILIFFTLSKHALADDLFSNIINSISPNNNLLSMSMSFIAGFLTCISPCVYPLIPITLSVMGLRNYQRRLGGFFIASSYVLGMMFMYCSLAIIFASIGGLMGSLMQNPIVLFVISIIFLAMALSSFGLFQIILPSKLSTKLTSFGGKGFKGAFVMGLLAGIIATPCTGPVLGFILTLIANQKNISFSVSLMIFFSLGMGLPFLLLGTFSEAIMRLPQSGSWLNIGKSILGLFMLITSFYYASLAFPKTSTNNNINDDIIIIDNINPNNLDLDLIINDAKKQKKAVIIDFYASWCVACLNLDKNTFSNEEVNKLLKNFVFVKIDVTKNSEYLVSLQNRFNVVGLPTIIILDNNGETISNGTIQGFISAEQMIKKLEKLNHNQASQN